VQRKLLKRGATGLLELNTGQSYFNMLMIGRETWPCLSVTQEVYINTRDDRRLWTKDDLDETTSHDIA
jgi:hypothetical protein